MDLNFIPHVRKPFEVLAVEVTVDNIEHLAPLIGQLKHKDNGTPYIQVDRRLVPNIFRVFPGFWMTRMGDNIRCYSKKIFAEQFVVATPELRALLEPMEEPEAPNPVAKTAKAVEVDDIVVGR